MGKGSILILLFSFQDFVGSIHFLLIKQRTKKFIQKDPNIY